MVELMRDRSSPSAFEASYRILWDTSVNEMIVFWLCPAKTFTMLFFILKNSNFRRWSLSIPLMQCKLLITPSIFEESFLLSLKEKTS
jgi:hypothetical protein